MALRIGAVNSDLVPTSDLPEGMGAVPVSKPQTSATPQSDLVPTSDLPDTAKLTPSPKRTPAQGEALRQQVEGPAPELEDAPIANAVISGALTPGTFAAVGVEGGTHGIVPALKSGLDFGVQQGLTDWVSSKLPKGLDKHPWLKEALGIAGGTALYMAGARGIKGPSPEKDISVLQRVAQSRALSEGEERMAGTGSAIMGEPPAQPEAEPIELKEPVAEELKPPEPPPPAAVQPKEELRQAVEAGDVEKGREALKAELNRHPDATVYDMRVGDLKRDPGRFQYKTQVSRDTGADAALQDLETYDRGLANIITVYHDPSGEYYVVNGHGRSAALERLEGADARHRTQIIESRPKDDPEAVQGAVRYGSTPEQARAYGAVINIAEGRGTAMDAARFFRSQGMDTAAMKSTGISLNPLEEKTQRAVALSQLSGQVFRAVDHGTLPEKLGIVIGRELGDSPTAQDGLYAMLKKKGGVGELGAQKLDKMIKLAKGSGETTEKSMTLFGPKEMKKSLMEEQADIINGLEGRLRGEKRLFGTVAEGARQIEEAGAGKVDPVTGEKISTTAAKNLDLLNRTAYTSGPVNQIVRDAAKELAENPKSKARIIRETYGKVAEELGKIIPEKAPESPQAGLFGAGAPTPTPMTEAPAALPAAEGGGYLGVGIPVVQAIERLRDVMPPEIREAPAKWGRKVQEIFAPETVSAFAQRASEIKHSAAAELRARIGSAARAVQPLRAHFDTLSETARYNLASQMEQRQYDALPEVLRGYGPAMTAITDQVHDRLQRLTPGQQIGYVDGYWRHMWANTPEEVHDAFAKIGSGKSLKVSGGFLKQRRFATIQDGIDAGLKPKYSNPVDQWMAGVQQEWRYTTGKEIWNAIKAAGMPQYFRINQKPPRGWAKIDDAITDVVAQTDKGPGKLGEWYVPNEVARIYNNWLHPGLEMKPLASLSALGNKVRVEFSGFHFLLTSASNVSDQVGSQVMEGLGDIAHGNVARGAFKLALSPAKVVSAPRGVYRDWRLGKDTITRALGGHFDDPAVHDSLLGGLDFDYGFQNPAHLIAGTWKDVFSLPERVADKLGNTIMKKWVAPLKVGTYLRLYNGEIGRALKENGAQELGFAQRRTIADQTRKYVDNVMGQIHRDNLDFSNRMKDSMHMLISYPGWQIGTVRLLGGMGRGIGKVASGKALDMQAQQALRFAAGLIVTGGTIGTLANFIMTGKMPQTVAEAFLWPTGDKDANGNAIRTEPPLYVARDLASIYGHRRAGGPAATSTGEALSWLGAGLQSVTSKMNWPLAAAWYLYQNADFFGKPIAIPNWKQEPEPLRKILGQFATEVAPFSVTNVGQMREQGKSPERALVAGALGLTPESAAMRQTPAQNFLSQYKPPQAPMLSADQQQRAQMLGKFEADLRRQLQGGPKADLGPIKQAIRSGMITQRQVEERMDSARQRPFALAVSRAPLPVSVQAWKIAHDNGDEQDEHDAARAIATKIRSGQLNNLPPDQQMAVRTMLRQFMSTIREDALGHEETP